MITEKGTSKNIEKAAEQGRVKFTQGLLSKKGEITPTERVANAKDVIAREIKKPATNNPPKLLKQIDAYGKKLATEKKGEFQQIKYNAKGVKKELTAKIKELQGLKDEFTLDEAKQFKQFAAKIDSVKNGADGRDARITWDKLFSQAQKQATDKSAPTTVKAQKLWTAGRNILNKDLDKTISNSNAGVGTKEAFYKLSSMLEAKENLVKNMPDLIKKTPTIAGKVAKGTAAVIGGGAILNWLGRKIGGGGQ